MDEICEDQVIDYLCDLSDEQRKEFIQTIQNQFCFTCGSWFSSDYVVCNNEECPTNIEGE